MNQFFPYNKTMANIPTQEFVKKAESVCLFEPITSEYDKIRRLSQRALELDRQVVIEKKKNQELSSAYSKRSSDLEKLRAGFNQAIELLVTALIEPEQITENEIYEFRTLELSVPKEQVNEEI